MAAGHSDNDDGSEIFWPGYVDATTNLILNLLFLLTILIVAVFMFALELGRAVGPQDANADATAVAEVAQKEPLQETVALMQEIARLKALLAEKQVRAGATGSEQRASEASSALATPEKGLDKARSEGFELVVRFKDDAVSFKESERLHLIGELKSVAASKGAVIHVEVPAGFSEAKRMGFYRALAVRNLLIEMNVPGNNIDVSVVEVPSGGNASVVKVGTR